MTANVASIRRVTEETLLEIHDLTGGIDLRQHPTRLDFDRSRRLVNWSISEPGALRVREGFLLHSSSDLGTRIQGGQRVYLSSNRVFSVVSWAGDLYRPTDTGAWGSPVNFSTLSSTAEVYFPYDRDIVAAFDGTTFPVKSTDGSTWTRMGILPSTADSTLADASSGNLVASQEYEVGFTYENNNLGHESNGGVVSTITRGGATGSIRVEVTGSTDPQVDSINVYVRNVTAGESVRRFASSVSNASGSTVSVLVSDSAWQGNRAEPLNNTVPPLLSFGAVWKNRWWARHATIRNRLHFTEIFQPESWPTTYFIDIPFPGSDDIRAIVPRGDVLVVFGYNNVFVLFGETSLTFEVRPALDSQDGALSQRAVVAVDRGLVHAGHNGVWLHDGSADVILSQDIEIGWRDYIQNATPTDIDRTAAVYHQDDKEIRIAVSRLYPTTGSGEWILDESRTLHQGRPAWTQTDRQIGGYISWEGPEQSALNHGRLFSWSDNTGQIFEESTGESANSSNLTALYEGPSFPVGIQMVRVIETWGEYESAAGTLSAETIIDGISQGRFEPDIGSGLSKYGTAVYGTDAYSGTNRRQFHCMQPLSAEGRSIQHILEYVGTARPRLFNYRWTIVPEARPREWSE